MKRPTHLPDTVGKLYLAKILRDPAAEVLPATTYRQFDEVCREISFGFRRLGLQAGERVAWVHRNSLESTLFYFAALGAGLVSEPLRTVSSGIAPALMICASSKELAAVDRVKKIVTVDAEILRSRAPHPDILTLAALREIGKRELSKNPMRFEEALKSCAPNDTSLVVHSEDTIQFTHEQQITALEDCMRGLVPWSQSKRERAMVYKLPSLGLQSLVSLLSFELSWNLSEPKLFDSSGPLRDELKSKRPTLIFTSAQGVRDLYDLLQRQSKSGWLERVSGPLIRSQRLKALGGKVKAILVWSGEVSRQIVGFFSTLGLPVLTAYTRQDFAGPLAMNTLSNQKIGSWGRPVYSVGLKVDSRGVIWIQTKKLVPTTPDSVPSWVETEDQGSLDSEGYLMGSGPKSETIQLSAGQSISPRNIERLSQGCAYIDELVVVGTGQSQLAALVTLRRKNLIDYAEEQGLLFSDFTGLVRHPRTALLVQAEIDAINRLLPPGQRIGPFVMLTESFSAERDERTTNDEPKRSTVIAHYLTEINRLFKSSPLTTDWGSDNPGESKNA